MHFQVERYQKHTPSSGTYLYNMYKGEYLPPPRPRVSEVKLCRKICQNRLVFTNLIQSLLFHISANVLFTISVVTMVVVSLFTKRIPRDELGGLTWPTINERPISHGAIGEDVESPEKPETMQMQGKAKLV